MYQEADDLEKQLLLREDEDTNRRENELGIMEEDEDDRSAVAFNPVIDHVGDERLRF